MMREEEYTGYEDMCDYNRWWKEANENRKQNEYALLKLQSAPERANHVEGALGSTPGHIGRMYFDASQDMM